MIDFPAAPVAGQIYFGTNGAVYQYSSTYTAWIQIASTVLQDGSFFATLASGVALTGSLVVQVPTTVLTGNAGGWYNVANGRYTPPAGRYYIFGSLNCFNGGGSGGGMELRLRKNGSATDLDFASITNVSGSSIHPSVWAEVDANGTDYFEILALTGASQGLISTVRFGAFPLSQAAAIPGGGSSWRQISRTVVGVATPTLDLQNIPSDINDIELRFDLLNTSADATLWGQFYDGSGALIATSYNYAMVLANGAAATSSNTVQQTVTGLGTSTQFPMTYGTAGNNPGTAAATGGVQGRLTINNIRDAARAKSGSFQTNYLINSGAQTYHLAGGVWRNAAMALTGLRLFFGAGNIAVGSTATLWGSP